MSQGKDLIIHRLGPGLVIHILDLNTVQLIVVSEFPGDKASRISIVFRNFLSPNKEGHFDYHDDNVVLSTTGRRRGGGGAALCIIIEMFHQPRIKRIT